MLGSQISPMPVQSPAKAHARHRPDKFDVSFLPDVDVAIDIGVAKGTPWFYDRFARSRLLLVDPLEKTAEVARMLSGRAHDYFQCALAAEPGWADVHINTALPSMTSLLERTALTRTKHQIETRKTEVRTLDSIVAGAVESGQTLGLKIDTEGYELEVLRGGIETLKRCAFVICEVTVAKRFENSYRFEELVGFLSDNGMSVAAMLTAERDGNGVIRFADMVFMPRSELG